MKGHIRQRSPGHWAIVLDVRDPATGKRKRRWHSFVGTKREAQIECSRLISDLQGGRYLEPNKITVSQHLTRWLEHIRGSVSPRTHERYTEIVHRNLVPVLGALLIGNLRPAQIADVYADALRHGRRDGKGGLSANTVLYMHRILRQSLDHAVRLEMIRKNPADAVHPPKVSRSAMSTYDMAETAELLDTVSGSRMMIPVLLGVLCGLRRGEIAALRWCHIDFANGILAVTQSAEQTREGVRFKEPKSGRARTVALSTTILEALRAHKVRQAEELLRLGVGQKDTTFVHAHEDGAPIQPRSITQGWRQLSTKMRLPRVRFHDLRHAHATHLLASGVHPKIASERLGHSKVGITLDLYSHVLPGMQADAAARVDDALRMALQRRPPRSVG